MPTERPRIAPARPTRVSGSDQSMSRPARGVCLIDRLQLVLPVNVLRTAFVRRVLLGRNASFCGAERTDAQTVSMLTGVFVSKCTFKALLQVLRYYCWIPVAESCDHVDVHDYIDPDNTCHENFRNPDPNDSAQLRYSN